MLSHEEELAVRDPEFSGNKKVTMLQIPQGLFIDQNYIIVQFQNVSYPEPGYSLPMVMTKLTSF